jgi:flagellar biosynthesis protein FliR
LDNMFSDVEKKLKSAAEFTFICDIVVTAAIVFGSMILGGIEGFLVGIVVAALYISMAIAKVQILYGFAELITCTKDIRNSIASNPQAASMVDEFPEL